MSVAFYSEAQIWPWVRSSRFVMLALNWSDKEDLVQHRPHRQCQVEVPHRITACGRFRQPVQA